MRHEIANILRHSNNEIQLLNSEPSKPDYEQKCIQVEERFKESVLNILQRYT